MMMNVDTVKQMNHIEKMSTVDSEEQVLNKSFLTSDAESGSDASTEEVSDVETGNTEKKLSVNRKWKMFGFMSLATIVLLAAAVVFVWATENEFGLSLIENTVGESLGLSLATKKKGKGKKGRAAKKRKRDDTEEDSDSDDEDEDEETTTTTTKKKKRKAKAAPAPAPAAPQFMMPTIMINNANGNSNAGANNVSGGGNGGGSSGGSSEDEYEYDPNAPEVSTFSAIMKQPACCMACVLPCINMKSSGSKAGLTEDESTSDCMIVMVLVYLRNVLFCANCILPCYLSAWKEKIYDKIRRKKADCFMDFCCFFWCTPCHIAAVDGTIDNTKKRVRRN